MGNLFAIARGLRHHSRSLVVRFILVGIALVAVGNLGRIAILSPALRDKVEALSAAHQLSIATYVAHDIEEKIRTRLDLLERTAAGLSAALLADPEALGASLRQRQETAPLFSRGMVVVPANGRGLLAEHPTAPGRASQDFSGRSWFLDATSGRTTVIGRPERSLVDNEPVIVMAVPVLDAAGAPVAVLAGITALAAPGFLNLVQENRIGKTGGFLLISPRDGIFVAADDPQKVLADTPPSGVNLLHDRAMAGFRGTGVTINAAGVEELSAIASVPTPGWFLVARLPTAEAFAAVTDLNGFILTNSLLVVCFGSLILFVALRRIFRPLTDAARRMHLMADGKIALAPLPIRRMDEVGELVFGFNYLLGKLREQEAALRESEARMAHMAHHDVLTGLPNRALFQDRLREALARAERNGVEFALMYIDLDGFKPINDMHGHGVGDEVLRQVARRLAGALRKADLVARIGGDEFAVLLMEQEDIRGAGQAVIRRCREAMAPPIEVEGHSVVIGISVGLAAYPADGRNERDLLARADHAMYAAKRSAASLARVP